MNQLLKQQKTSNRTKSQRAWPLAEQIAPKAKRIGLVAMRKACRGKMPARGLRSVGHEMKKAGQKPAFFIESTYSADWPSAKRLKPVTLMEPPSCLATESTYSRTVWSEFLTNTCSTRHCSL